MMTLVGIAVVAFVVTNLDDLVVLTAFCGHDQYQLREILFGQYLGFGALLAISIVAGVSIATYLDEYVRWLGLFPIGIGLLWYASARRGDANAALGGQPIGGNSRSRTGLVAGIGITDGADNIGVYVPLFAASGMTETGVIAVIFLVAAGAWVLLAQWLALRPGLANRLEEYGNVVIPVVLVGIGVVILADLV